MTSPPIWDAPTDEEIVRRVQQGDGKLFSVIFERHYARLERYVRHAGVPDGDLEDILAETFTRAFARIASFDAESGVRYVSYLYAIARNLMADRLRARRRLPEPVQFEEVWREPDPNGVPPVELVLRRDELSRIRRALQRLSDSDREIITLSYDRELSCREIMEIMGKPSVTAVTTHLYKAMKRLREEVSRQEKAVHAGAGTR